MSIIYTNFYHYGLEPVQHVCSKNSSVKYHFDIICNTFFFYNVQILTVHTIKCKAQAPKGHESACYQFGSHWKEGLVKAWDIPRSHREGFQHAGSKCCEIIGEWREISSTFCHRDRPKPRQTHADHTAQRLIQTHERRGEKNSNQTLSCFSNRHIIFK